MVLMLVSPLLILHWNESIIASAKVQMYLSMLHWIVSLNSIDIFFFREYENNYPQTRRVSSLL